MEKVKGLLIAVLIAVVSYFSSDFIPGLNGVLLALILGMIIGNTVQLSDDFKPGINYAGATVLELSIVLLAFGINPDDLMSMGLSSFLMVLAIIAFTLIATLLFNKRLNCPGNSGLLVGFGSAICGSGAIAALAPSINSKSEDVGISLPVINVTGGIAMILLPLILEVFPIDDFSASILIGGSLPSVGNAAGAGFALSEEVGNLSVTIKMMRVAMLAPAVLIFGYFVNRKSSESTGKKLSIPNYLIAFAVITIGVFFIELPSKLEEVTSFTSDAGITISMAAIGLKTKLSALIQAGQKAIMFGFVIYLLMLAFIIAMLQLV